MKLWIEGYPEKGYADVCLEKGRRKMRWTFDYGTYEPESLAETLSDILAELGVPSANPNTPATEAELLQEAIREYQASIENGLAQGAKLIDPRVNVQKEGDVLNSPTHGPFLRDAQQGAQFLAGDEATGVDWGRLAKTTVDYDSSSSVNAAAARAQSGGVTVEGRQETNVDYVARWAQKNSDHVKGS